MPNIIAERIHASARTMQAIAEDTRRRFGAECRYEWAHMRTEDALKGRAPVCFLLSFPEGDNPIVDHPLGGLATCEWWQRPNLILGQGTDGGTLEELAEDALAMARRGQIEALKLTAWFNRFAKRPGFEFYEYSRRDPSENYQPTGRKVSDNRGAGLIWMPS